MAVKVYFAPAPLQYQSEIEMQTYQPIWVEINNTIFGLEDFSITFRKANADDSSNNVTQESISKELDFYDGAYTFIHEQLVTQRREFIYVKLVNECEGCEPLLHFGVIKRKNLKSCDCDEAYRAQINGISRDEIIKARLESILAMDEILADSFQPSQGPNVIFQMVQDRLSKQRQTDKFGVPGIRIKSMFERIGQRLGMNVYSSIFFDYNAINGWSGDDYSPTQIPQGYNVYNPYFYLYLVYYPIMNSEQKDNQNQFQNLNEPVSNNIYYSGGSWQPIKRPNWLSWSAFRFLNSLANVFNAQWRIKNGQLEFERKDYFFLSEDEWLDLTDYKACYTITDFNNFAYLDFDFAGSKSEVQSTINPRSNVLCGSSIIQNPWIDFSTEYLSDPIDWSDGLSFIQREPKIKQFDFGYAPVVRYAGSNKVAFKDGYSPYPTLYCAAENSADNRKFVYGGIGTSGHQPMLTAKYFFDYCLNERTNQLIPENLYDNFHFIDDPLQRPNSKGFTGKNSLFFHEFEINSIPFNCQTFANFDINKTVKLKKGSGIMDEVEFNWSQKTVNIRGRI
jgi:hypothetical protein